MSFALASIARRWSHTSSAAGGSSLPINTLSRHELSRQLVSWAYNDSQHASAYDAVVSHLCRTDVYEKGADRKSTLFNVKEFEVLLRFGLVPKIKLTDLCRYSQKYLEETRNMKNETLLTPPEIEYEESILNVLKQVCFSVKPNISIGPYHVHFCQLEQPEGVSSTNDFPTFRTLTRYYTAVEIGHQQTTFRKNADMSAKIRSSVLRTLGIHSVFVPYADWSLFEGDIGKQTKYLQHLLGKRRYRLDTRNSRSG